MDCIPPKKEEIGTDVQEEKDIGNPTEAEDDDSSQAVNRGDTIWPCVFNPANNT
jgi:hypothetical protein